MRRASQARNASALGLQHRPGAVLHPALAAPELLHLRGVRFVEGDAVVVGQLLARLDRADRLDEHLVLVALALGVLLDHRLAVGLTAVVDPARDVALGIGIDDIVRSEEHKSELHSLMRISYAVFCLKKK